MEAAVRWSPHSTADRQRFLVVDVADPALTLNEVQSIGKTHITHSTIARSGRIANFGAFDWSKTNESIIALGLVSGSAHLLRLRYDGQPAETVVQYRIKQQRKCNSIAFSSQDWLAVAVDRARSDVCLFIYDARRGHGASSSAVRKLCAAEVVSSVRFFPSQPQEIVASTQRQFIRLYDLREGGNATGGSVQATTKNVNNIAIDPCDENYLASAGSTDDPCVTVWDRRWMSSSPGASSSSGAVFDFKPAVNNSQKTTVWSLRYSGQRRGRLAICSSVGELNIVDMIEGKTTALSSSEHIPPNPHGGAGPWTSNRYVSQTRVLERPSHDAVRGRDSKMRIIAYDWMFDGRLDPTNPQSILALRPNREVDVLRVPVVKTLSAVTPRSDLSITYADIAIVEPTPYTKHTPADAPSEHINGTRAEDFGPREYDGEIGPMDDNNSLSQLNSTRVGGMLASAAVQSERCRRGYLFDCEKNMQIVAGNWQLERLWEIINRFQELAGDDGMFHSGLDLSYVGITGLWSENIGTSSHRRPSGLSNRPSDAIVGLNSAKDIPAFEGHRTAFPEHRQLCLAACGWRFTTESLEAECQELIERGLHYQAIVQAVLHEHKHMALNLLRSLIRSRTIPNVGLGALLASSSINDDQKEMCSWMAADTEDPALKALLTFLVKNNWKEVMKTNYLHLGYRLALGLKYLDDTELSNFIQFETARAVKNGDLEGILLTGLGEQAMDLFQIYITRTNDLQTAVLATAFTNPLFVDDVRWEMWKETYFMQMQAWRCFIPRTKFTVQHNRIARTREGEALIKPPPAQVTLRCLHCQGSLAMTDSKYVTGQAPQPKTGGSGNAIRVPGPPANAGTICPTCGRHLPRCGLCRMWLGTPNPSTVGGAQELSKLDDVMAKLISFCKLCGHGFHADHARSWFGKHDVCPVPDCRCSCGMYG